MQINHLINIHGIIAAILFVISAVIWYNVMGKSKFSQLLSVIFSMGFVLAFRQVALIQGSSALNAIYNVILFLNSLYFALVIIRMYNDVRSKRIELLKDVVNVNIENPLKDEINREVIRPEIKKLEQLGKELNSKKKELEKMKERLDSQEDRLGDLKEQISEERLMLKNESDELKKSKDEMDKEKKEMQSRRSEFERTLRDINKRKTDLAKADKSINDEKKRLADLKDNFNHKIKESERITLEMIKLKEEKTKMVDLKEKLMAKEVLLRKREESMIDREYDLKIKEKKSNVA